MSILHPHQTPDGKTTRVWLDWGDSSHYGGPVRPCGSCGQGTRTLNDGGSPQHKACAEYELEHSRNHLPSQRAAEKEPGPEAAAEAGT